MAAGEAEAFGFGGSRTAEDDAEAGEAGEPDQQLTKLGSSSTAELRVKDVYGVADGGYDDPADGARAHQMPPASVMTRLILIMVWRKLIRNPNTYSSLIGLAWSLVAFRYAMLCYKVYTFSRDLLPAASYSLSMLSIFY